MRLRIALLFWAVCLGMIGLPVTTSAQTRVAFVTSATGTANLSTWDEAADGLTGLAAADSICTTLAEEVVEHFEITPVMNNLQRLSKCRLSKCREK